MTRAEWFVLNGRGHWATCRVPFVCDCSPDGQPCLARVAKGEPYLATKIAKYPDARPDDRARYHACRRYCARCADRAVVV